MNLQNKDGRTALMMAIDRGHLYPVGYLLESGANVNLQDNEGWTALMYASYLGDSWIIKALLAFDADANIPSNQGLLALDIANFQNRRKDPSLYLPRLREATK